jgi:hypothetical protein
MEIVSISMCALHTGAILRPPPSGTGFHARGAQKGAAVHRRREIEAAHPSTAKSDKLVGKPEPYGPSSAMGRAMVLGCQPLKCAD